MNSECHQPHILCINHAPEILDLLRDLLEGEGYRVSTKQSIDHSLETIIELNPDAITIDYMWDTSDNEWTYLNLLTMDPRTQHIPVVLCTGAVKKAKEMEDHLESIGVRVVMKPFDLEVLLEALSSSLEAKPLAESDDVLREEPS